MKRKALYGVAVLAGTLAVATVALRPRARTETEPRAPARPAAAAAKAAPSPASLARLSEDPTLARAMKCWRVHEDLKDGVYRARSHGYEAEVGRDGLTFRAAGRTLSLRPPTVEQSGRALPCDGGSAARAAYGHAVIDRSVLKEEYVFDNGRVEQLFRIPQPLGEGELTVRIPVETDLQGGVVAVPASTEGKLQGAGLKFSEADGKVRFHYHTAVALDAAGERVALTPRYEDGAIALAVPAEFMARAAYPVVVDPFLELDNSASAGGFSLTTGFSDSPSIQIEGGGNPYVVWSERVTTNPTTGAGNFEIFLRYWNGMAWTNIGGSDQGGGISNNAGDSTQPSLSLNGDGRLGYAVAWTDDTSGNIEIYLRAWNGSTWTELAHDAGFSSASSGGVSATTGESRNPVVDFAVAITPFTNPVEIHRVPVVAWEDTSFGLTEILAMAWYPGDPGDSNFNIDATDLDWYQLAGSRSFGGLSQTFNGVSERPKMFVDFSNRVVVAWQDSVDVSVAASTYEIYLSRFAPSPVMIGAFNANPNGEFYPFSGQVAGLWAGVGGSATGGGLSNTPGPAPVGRSVYPSLAQDPGTGDLYVAWEESRSATNNEIFVARNVGGSAGTWTAVGTGPGGNVSNALAGISNTAAISRTPSVGVDTTNRPCVVWVDEEPSNFEIYCRQFDGATWTEVGFGGNSASIGPVPGLGGVSKTFNASLHPVVQVGNGGLPTAIWAEFVTAGSGGNTFEIYARRFYIVEPRSLHVVSTDPALPPNTDIPPGGTTSQNNVQIRCRLFHETPRASYFEVEVKPISTQFAGTVTASSSLVTVDPVTHLSPAAPGDASVLFSGLMNTSYHIRFRGVDDVGRKSPWIGYGGNADGVADFTISAAPPGVPAAPTNLIAGLSGTSVQLSWTAPVGGASTYNVFRSTTAGFVPALANRIATGVTTTSHLDSTVSTGTQYFYLVTGVNSQGEGPASNEATVTTLSVPGAPTGLAGAASGNNVALSWTPPAGGATSYNIYRDGGQIATGQTATTYNDTGLSFNTTYTYTVRAVNAVGEGPASNAATVTTGGTGGGSGGGGAAADEEDEACGLLGIDALLALMALSLRRRRRR